MPSSRERCRLSNCRGLKLRYVRGHLYESAFARGVDVLEHSCPSHPGMPVPKAIHGGTQAKVHDVLVSFCRKGSIHKFVFLITRGSRLPFNPCLKHLVPDVDWRGTLTVVKKGLYKPGLVHFKGTQNYNITRFMDHFVVPRFIRIWPSARPFLLTGNFLELVIINIRRFLVTLLFIDFFS
ncbi:hypothetical protein M422DRAFT_245955 [Sphaerobolus stellatus SS14]|nr:hypothetical protein M422DRAFT_245955 [Sphaerobolus stellatus SS14]